MSTEEMIINAKERGVEYFDDLTDKEQLAICDLPFHIREELDTFKRRNKDDNSALLEFQKKMKEKDIERLRFSENRRRLI